jgi:hypothetical protein
MPRIITENEIQRRQAMARAKSAITETMCNHSLTALEWVNVLNESMQRMIQHGLAEEWNDN